MYDKNVNKLIIEKLKNKQPSIGSWIQIPNNETAEIMSNSGYDWLAVDLEHGPISKNHLTDLSRIISNSNVVPIARVADSIPRNCKDALDCGFSGLILPNIISSNQLEELVFSAFYPPYGERGVGFARSNLYGKNFNKEALNFEPLIVAQIENIKALDDLEKICKIKKLSSIFIGPYDLSASMGIAGEFDNPEYLKAEKQITKIAKENSLPFGKHIVEPNLESLKLAIDNKYQFIAYSTDAFFLHQNSKNPY